MKQKIGILAVALFVAFGNLNAQDVTTVEATDSDISDNLDLEAVASVFGEAEDLEDFEEKLNDPDTQISNLDLNEDGEVDYLRVVEASEDETHLVTIQAVIAEDQYQDVAVIDVEKGDDDETNVQVVGDVYMYGPDYIITPVYVHPPVIVVWFWGPYYNPWRSPYYWGYYPPYYRPWQPYPAPRYRTNVHVHVNVNNSYHRTTVRKSTTTVELQNRSRKNDYGSKNPRVNNNKVSTGKQVQDDWKPESEKKGNKSKVKDNKVSVPSERPNAKPAAKPDSKPAARPAAKPKSNPRKR